MNAQRKGDVFEHIEVREQGAALEEHTHLLAHVEQLAARQRRQIGARHPDLAMGRFELGSDQAQQRSLAAAGRAHDGRHLAAGNDYVDVIENAPLTALEGDTLQLDGVSVGGAHWISSDTACESDALRSFGGTSQSRF